MGNGNRVCGLRISTLAGAGFWGILSLSGCAVDTEFVGESTENLSRSDLEHGPGRKDCGSPEARATGPNTIQSVITTTGIDQYHADQTGVVDAKVCDVWGELGRLDEFFRVSLPSAENIHWVKGDGSAVGDELMFILSGEPILLSVVERNERTHRFRYGFMQSALGIADIQSDLRIDKQCGHAKIQWIRDFRMEPGVSFEALRDIVSQEFVGLIAHYE